MPPYSLEQLVENIQQAHGPMEMAMWANMLGAALREHRRQEDRHLRAEQEIGRLPTEAEHVDKQLLGPQDMESMMGVVIETARAAGRQAAAELLKEERASIIREAVRDAKPLIIGGPGAES